MICLSCPMCDADVEFTLDTEEVFYGMAGIRLVPVVDAVKRDCACTWTEEMEQSMRMAAERAACEMED